MKNWILAAGLAVLALIVILQATTVRGLKSEVEGLRAELGAVAGTPEPGEAAPFQPATRVSLGNLPHRVTTLEEQMAALARTSQVLVDRGMIPPSEAQRQEIKNKFYDPNASDRDRLAALRLIRRGGEMTDDVAFQAMNWLQSATNGNTRRQLLGQLDGLTNAVIKQPLLAMLNSETDGRVREELVDVLAEFSNDPLVEQKMWDLAFNDPNPEVREEAHDALTDDDMPPQRVEAFKARAIDPNISLDQRLMALDGLREANAATPEVMSQFASLAQTSQDPLVRERLFRAFDGMNDPSLLPTLVGGLQDANPVVRERAVDALGSHSGDPRIQEWLNHVIQNDTDPRVKREAHQALAESQRRRGEGRRGN